VYGEDGLDGVPFIKRQTREEEDLKSQRRETSFD